MVALECCYCGPLDKGHEVIRPVKSFGPPLQDLLGPMPYSAQQSLTDAGFPAGSFYYTKGGFMADLADEAIEVFAEYAAIMPSATMTRTGFASPTAPTMGGWRP